MADQVASAVESTVNAYIDPDQFESESDYLAFQSAVKHHGKVYAAKCLASTIVLGGSAILAYKLIAPVAISAKIATGLACYLGYMSATAVVSRRVNRDLVNSLDSELSLLVDRADLLLCAAN